MNLQLINLNCRSLSIFKDACCPLVYPSEVVTSMKAICFVSPALIIHYNFHCWPITDNIKFPIIGPVIYWSIKYWYINNMTLAKPLLYPAPTFTFDSFTVHLTKAYIVDFYKRSIFRFWYTYFWLKNQNTSSKTEMVLMGLYSKT